MPALAGLCSSCQLSRVACETFNCCYVHCSISIRVLWLLAVLKQRKAPSCTSTTLSGPLCSFCERIRLPVARPVLSVFSKVSSS